MMLASERTVSSVLKLIRGHNRLHSTLGEWDRHPWLLNTPDGVVDLRTGKLREHRRSDFITQSTSVTPHKGCQPVRFLQFLDEITDNDVDLRQFWKRVFGYSLLGANPEHAIFFGFGTGRNGKTVLRKTFAEILHTYHCTAPMEAFTQKRMSQHPTEIADLRGKRLVTAIETEPGTRWNETRLKELSGGDEIATRHMRQDFFRFIPVCKLLFFGNNKPGLKNVDTAIRERFLMLPFPHEFLADDRDKWLYDSLRQEWPGILQWAMKVVWNGSSWEDLIPRQACGVKPKNILRSRIRSGDSSMNVARLSRVRDVSVSSCIQNGGLTATRWEKRRGPPLFFIS
jgi:putative DNA primase/helicase